MTEDNLLLFLAHLDSKNMSHSSAHVYISAIRNLHVLNGLPELVRTPKVRLAVKAMQLKSPKPRQKAPITFPVLCMMWPALEKMKDNYLFKAVIALGYFGGLRADEYTHNGYSTPSVSQVAFTSNGLVMNFSVKRSKTCIHGFSRTIGCSKNDICAVCAMRSYLASRGPTQPQSPLFVDASGNSVTKARLNSVIKDTMQSLGLDPTKYSAHSLRAGVATTAGQIGFSAWEIKQLGGWKSSTYMQYIRPAPAHATNYANRLTRLT